MDLKITKAKRKTIRLFVLFYLGTYLLLNLIVLIFLWSRADIPRAEIDAILLRFNQEALDKFFVHLFLQIPFLGFLLIRYWTRALPKKGWTLLFRRLLFTGILPFFAIWLSLRAIDRYRTFQNFDYEWDYKVENTKGATRAFYEIDEKQRGMHMFGLSLSNGAKDLEILQHNNFEWITFTPFLSQDQYNTPSLRAEFNFQDSIKYFQKWIENSELARSYGFKIMLKPHVWMTSNGKWRSDIAMETEEDWDTWMQQYRQQFLNYAQLADTMKADIFCIGTELQAAIKEKPEFWRQLIKEIRAIYKGQLTYAANWNQEVEEVSFWDDLDFIGVQGYFPLCKQNYPTLKVLEEGWEPHIQLLGGLHQKYNKPVLFTELGYKSTPDAGVKPWAWNNFANRFYKKIDHKTQALCYQAFFNTIWQEDWMAGVHIWEWQSSGGNEGMNNGFTIYNKPALNVVAKGFYINTN